MKCRWHCTICTCKNKARLCSNVNCSYGTRVRGVPKASFTLQYKKDYGHVLLLTTRLGSKPLHPFQISSRRWIITWWCVSIISRTICQFITLRIINLTPVCVSLNCGRKLEHRLRNHTDTSKPWPGTLPFLVKGEIFDVSLIHYHDVLFDSNLPFK